MTEPAQSNLRRPMIVCASLATLLATIWLASQSGVTPLAAGKFAAVLVILLEALPALLALWLGAAGLGYPLRLLLTPTLERGRTVTQLGLGMAAMLLLVWSLAWAGQLHMTSAWGVCGLGGVLLLVQAGVMRRRKSPANDTDEPVERHWPWSVVLWMPPLGLLLVAAACPPGTLWQVEAFGYDVLSYHLQLPREWLALGAMSGLEHNVYSYLPSLVEAGYMQLGAMHGSMHGAIYTAQLFHVSFALLAAAGVAQAAGRFVDRSPAAAAGAVLLATPWVLVTGSLAYNEMAVLAFMAVALVVMFDLCSERWSGAAAVGLLVGAATLAKLTAGFFVAVPLALVLLTRLNHAHRWRKPPRWPVGVKAAAVAALAGTLVLAPYLVRNYTWTNNPVFPFAADLLGTGHWDDELKQRWDAGHGLTWDEANRFQAFHRQWLFNAGYGALGGFDVDRSKDRRNIPRFAREGGFPLLWVAMLGGALLCVNRRGMRRAVTAMGVILVAQFAFWLFGTHLQSRFLIPTLVPAVLVVGLGVGRLAEMTRANVAWLWPTAAGLVVVLLSLSGLTIMFNQTQLVTLDDGRRARAPLAFVIDSRPDPRLTDEIDDARSRAATHPINELPADSRTLLIADNSALLHIDRPTVYHSAFDASPLGEMIRQTDGHPGRVNELLREAGITHVWVHWSELDRLHSTYGHDRDVNVETLEQLIATGWQPVYRGGQAVTLYALP